MRMKIVKRYWCDHCNKAGLSAHAMAKHELHCTMNPDRNCRVCTLINGGYTVGREEMAKLLALLPEPSDDLYSGCTCPPLYDENHRHLDTCSDPFVRLTRDMLIALPKLREATDNCPACILAALRQKGITVPMVEGFDFTAEMKRVFAEHKADQGWPY